MSIKSLTQDFAFYGLLDLLQRSLGIVMIPIYTRVLSQTNYGDLDLIVTLISALTVLVDLQLVAGFSRFYLEHKNSGNGPRFVGTSLLSRAVIGILLAVIILACGFTGLLEVPFIPSFLSNSTAWTFMLLGIPLSLTFDVLLLQAQMLRLKKSFFIGAVGNTLFSAGLCILFTIYFKLGITGVVLGQFIGRFVSTGLLFLGLKHEISFHYSRPLFRELLRYTLPLVPGWWLGFSSAYVSRFFVYGALGAGENAILAITTKIASVLGLFSVAFRTAWQPLAMSYIGDDNGGKFYVGSLRLFMAAGLLSAFSLSILAKPLLTILAPNSYNDAIYYVPYFLVGSIIGELDVNLQLGNQISKKTYWMSIGSGLAFLINLAILTAFTSRIGIYAAGIGLLLSFMVKAAITYLSAQRNYRIPYDKKAFSVFCLGCTVLLVLSIGRGAGMVNHMVYYCSATLFGIMLPWFTLAATEREYLKGALERLSGRIALKWSTRHP